MVIRQGRDVVDRAGIAALHQYSFSSARDLAIWNWPGHPTPVTGGTRLHGGRARRRLWDREQAAAFAEDRPVPRLPTDDQPGDLLDTDEVTASRGLAPRTVAQQTAAGYFPPPDATPYGVAHWRRDTLERAARQPPRQGARTDRAPSSPTGTAQQRVQAVLETNPSATLAEIMTQARVSRPTAARWREHWQARGDLTS